MKITVISGTNRPQSQTLRISNIFKKHYQEAGAQVELLDLQNLPPALFTPQAYALKPVQFEKYSSAVLEADGLAVVTPEYNGSFPGVLKVFIDHLKFPESFDKKPVSFVGLAGGMWGGLRSVEQLEMIFKYRNALTFGERIFLPRVETQLTTQDTWTSELVSQLVKSQVTGFLDFCKKLKK
jgi:chromate reductase